MRFRQVALHGVATVALVLGGWDGQASAEGPARYEHDEMNTWGKWGASDEKGAANYITPGAVVEAAGLIETGETFSLAIPLDGNGPVFPGRSAPHHTMSVSGTDFAAGAASPFALGDQKFADDYIFMPLQGSTQWDALSHGWYGDTLYNGVPQTAIQGAPMAGGATKLGIENIRDTMVGRGVLIDVLRHKGGRFAPGTAITRADLEAALAAQGTEVKPGDMVIVRTGYVPAFYQLKDPVARLQMLTGPHTGLASDVVPWVKQHQIAGIAADNLALEVVPNPNGMEKPYGVHGNLLRDLGVYIGEIWWLEDLAAHCAADGRYEFFLSAAPLNLTGAVGSPINPIAIK